VLTTTRSKIRLARAASIVYAIKGLPFIDRTFFPGIRFDPLRAGMTARQAEETSVTL
jgi:hypothetical protein